MTTAMVRSYARPAPEKLHDVRENARKLSVLYSVEVELARLVGSWIARTPELPEKMTLARVLYEDADHARLLGQRLPELRVPQEQLDLLRQRTAPVFKALEQADDPNQFLAVLFGAVKPQLIADYRRHLDAAPPYVDEPSVRWIGQILREEQEHLTAGLALLSERGVHPAHADGLWDLDAETGGLVEGVFVGRDPAPLASPVWPTAVTKLASEQPMPPYPQEFEAAMRRCVHDLVFSENRGARHLRPLRLRVHGAALGVQRRGSPHRVG
jgi:hypothetical protein